MANFIETVLALFGVLFLLALALQFYEDSCADWIKDFNEAKRHFTLLREIRAVRERAELTARLANHAMQGGERRMVGEVAVQHFLLESREEQTQ